MSVSSDYNDWREQRISIQLINEYLTANELGAIAFESAVKTNGGGNCGLSAMRESCRRNPHTCTAVPAHYNDIELRYLVSSLVAADDQLDEAMRVNNDVPFHDDLIDAFANNVGTAGYLSHAGLQALAVALNVVVLVMVVDDE